MNSFFMTFWRKQVRFRLLEVAVLWLMLCCLSLSLGYIWAVAMLNGLRVMVVFEPEIAVFEGLLILATFIALGGWLAYKMIASGDDPEIGQP